MTEAESEPTFPRTAGQLRAWLRDTDAGHEILRDAAAGFLEDTCRKCQRLRPYPKVLVIAREWDGVPGVEVIREHGVAVKLVEKADGLNNKTLEDMAERLLAKKLPRSWADLLLCYPARHHDEITCRTLTVTRAIEVFREMQMLKELRDIRQELIDRSRSTLDGVSE